jgi:acyl carrier protein
MGLDAVEIVLRTEELFVITIGDDEAAAVRTVGTSTT